jgi:hypothetical protein
MTEEISYTISEGPGPPSTSADRLPLPVCLEDFVRPAIDYYDVKPRLSYAEWTGILNKNEKAFDKGATWKIMPS